jgi:hypothetical protein
MKKTVKKILLYGFGTFLFLVIVLAAHIYYYYRPAPDASTRIMARIDIKQQINQDEANKIAAWMFHQKGVDHVLVNPQTDIVIFTFSPLLANGNQIVKNFKTNFNLRAERFIPSDAQMKSGCPMAASSFTYKVYKLVTNII